MTEEEFFHKGESGGTFISSGYNKALEIIDERYHPALVERLRRFTAPTATTSSPTTPPRSRPRKELTQICNLFGYGEIKPLGRGLLRQQHDQFFSQIQEAEFPDRADSAEGRYLAFLQDLSDQRPRAKTPLDRIPWPTAYSIDDLERWNERIVELVEHFGLDPFPQEFEICDHERHALVHGLLRHAVALPALVLRQDLREAQDPLRLRRERSALRDGDQLQSVDRVSHARQHARAAGSDHRACLRPQRFFQKQLHVSHDSRRIHHRNVQERTPTGCATTSKIRASAWRRSKPFSTPRMRCRLQCRRNLAIKKLTADGRAQNESGGIRAADRSVSAAFIGAGKRSRPI